jgi:two-component system, LytTR family, response regulator
MLKLNCLIVDDETMARKLLEENLRQFPFLTLVGACKNPFEAMEMLQTQAIDLMFLDIQMPGMLGTQFLRTLTEPPMVILVTAYANYAVESYDLNVLDYLVKPTSIERFGKAVQKAMDEQQKKLALAKTPEPIAAETTTDFFFVHADYALVKVVVAEITHIEGMRDYVKIFTTGVRKPILTKATLKSIEEKLPATQFMRVHKSFIVQLSKIESLRHQQIRIGDIEIPVSDVHHDALLRWLQGGR